MIDRLVVSEMLSTEVLFEEPIALLAPPGNPMRGKSPLRPEDLDRADLILTNNGSYRTVLEEILADGGIRPASIMESASIEAIKKLVISGLGTTLLPRAVVLEELRSGRLIDLGGSGLDFEIKNQIVYHKGKWLSPALRAMVDMPCSRSNRGR